jgi:transcriptional regulator with XRE-family HTH domain
MTLGTVLREYRLRAYLTVREAASALGLQSHSRLVAFENDQATPSLEQLTGLATVYNTTIYSFLLPETVANLIPLLEQASPELLDQIHYLLEHALPEAPAEPNQ